jgi:hypothetical protein
MRRNKIFTPEVYVKIPVLLAQGLGVHEIAERIGCTHSTLKVRCSNAGISLRQPRQVVKIAPKLSFTPTKLSPEAMAYYRQQSEMIGTSTIKLVTELLEVIAQDNLLNAVLDNTQLKEAA